MELTELTDPFATTPPVAPAEAGALSINRVNTSIIVTQQAPHHRHITNTTD